MFHLVTIALLLATSTPAIDRETAGHDSTSAAVVEMLPWIESTDFIANKYWEEFLLLDNTRRLYANILPSITNRHNKLRTESPISPVAKIISDRFPQSPKQSTSNLGKLLRRSELDGSTPSLRLRLNPYVEDLIAEDVEPVHRVGINVESWVRTSAELQVHVRARIENHGELYSQFSGRKWKEKITGWLDNAAVYFCQKGIFGSVGRSYLIWGPQQRDALLISDNSPAFDRIWLGYEHRFFRFDYVIARLDDIRHNDSTLVRYFSAHRLSFRKKGVFEFGLSEVALYGGYNRSLEWRYLNPFLLYYWEQYNLRSDDNLFLGLDASIFWPKRCRAFGELMIDDFQIDFKSEPHQVGYKLGIDAMEPFGLSRLFSSVSYTRVNTTVYGQNRLQNLYLNAGQPIGYFGGNDQDRAMALLRYHVSTSCDLELELQYNRRGEGRIELHSSSAVPKGVKFPSGIVEKSPSVRLTAALFGGDLWQGHITCDYQHFANYRHQRGCSHDQFGMGLKLSYFLQGSFD